MYKIDALPLRVQRTPSARRASTPRAAAREERPRGPARRSGGRGSRSGFRAVWLVDGRVSRSRVRH